MRPIPSAVFLSLLCASSILRAADPAIRFDSSARSGSKIRIEGTSNIHDWQVESALIGGFVEAGPSFPVQPGQPVAPGKLDARVEVFIPVRSLASIEKDGRPYSTAMDDIMHEKLRMEQSPRILYHLTELSLKEAPKTPDAPCILDSKGELVVAGVTNSISMPVTLTRLADQKIKLSGAVSVKMTEFKIDPPAPKIALGLIKTGDEVKLSFDWVVARKKPAP